MARPSAEVIKTLDCETKVYEILDSPGYFIIVYKDQPINLRSKSLTDLDASYKYQKLMFANEGNAEAQARRLNSLFNCKDFTVRPMFT